MDTATTEFYTLPQHDALPIGHQRRGHAARGSRPWPDPPRPPAVRHQAGLRWRGHHHLQPRPALHHQRRDGGPLDRKSTRLNSSHANISYAVFCLKKKNIPSTLYLSSSPLTLASISFCCCFTPSPICSFSLPSPSLSPSPPISTPTSSSLAALQSL